MDILTGTMDIGTELPGQDINGTMDTDTDMAVAKKREADPQVLLAHPYAYAHYVPTTYVAPTVFNHENHPSTVITATGHHVYAAPWVVAAKPAEEAERKKREAGEEPAEGPNADPAADAWYAYYGYPAYHRGYYGYGLGGYYGHRYY